MGPRSRSWIPLAAVGLVGALLFLPRLGTSGLWDPWEPKYAQAPREMTARGNWLIPYFHDDARLNKPPVTYWLIGAAQAALGPSESAARLPSALLAIACAVALGLAFAAHRRTLEGLVAGVALLTMPQWSLVGRFATPDAPLAAALGIAMAAIVAATAGERPRVRVASGIAIAAVAVAALTDWPRGLLLPAWAALAWGAFRLRVPWIAALGASCALYYAGQHLYSVPLNLAAIAIVVSGAIAFGHLDLGVPWRTWAIVLALLVVVVTPWFVLAWRMEPEELSIFEYEHALNLGETLRAHRAGFDYVPWIVGIGGMPWSAAAVLGALHALRRRADDDLARLLAGALVGPLLFFTLAEPKMGHFYGVMQPAAAGLAAIGLVAFVRKADWRSLPAAAALVLLGAAAWRDPSRVLETATVKSALYGFDLRSAVAISIGAWVALVATAKLLRREAWLVAAALGPAYLAGVLGMRMVPALEPTKSIKPLWTSYVEARRPGEPIGRLGEVKFGCYYYSDDAIADLDSPDDAREFFGGAGDRFLIAPRKTFREKLEPNPPGPGRWDLVDDTHSSHVLVRFSRGEAESLDGEGLVDEPQDP